MQEIWLHVFRNRASLDLERLEAFPGWLAVLARRRCIDLLRSAPVRAESLDDEAQALDWLHAAPNQGDAAELKDIEAAVKHFQDSLKPAWRSFFDLHFVQGLEYAEVADRLGISKLRCKYMKKVLAARARKNIALLTALGRFSRAGGGDAS